MALNELRDGMQDTLPPSDSRLRPDVRILEQGNIGMHSFTYSSPCSTCLLYSAL